MDERGERLQKVLARAGVASRRASEELITAGRVTVNGRTAGLGDRVQADDDVRVDGAPLPGAAETQTFMLNKPPGYLTAARDERGRKTVMDLVPAVPGLHPVGRLDLESEGLLLLSTDGELTLKLTHPRYRHRKTYRVWTDRGRLDDRAVAALLRGVELEDGVAAALEARALPEGCSLVLAEGRKRQVRRMLASLGYGVVRLQRTAVGRLELGDLPLGGWRRLAEGEVAAALADGGG